MSGTLTHLPDPGLIDEAAAIHGRTSSEAARRVGVHGSTMVRWILKGGRLSDGSRFRLSAKRIPGRWLVADDDVIEFLARMTADRLGDRDGPKPREEESRGRAGSRARRILDEAGIN